MEKTTDLNFKTIYNILPQQTKNHPYTSMKVRIFDILSIWVCVICLISIKLLSEVRLLKLLLRILKNSSTYRY